MAAAHLCAAGHIRSLNVDARMGAQSGAAMRPREPTATRGQPGITRRRCDPGHACLVPAV